MRFIFNFIFFGILFYLIWLFFPDAFKTLVSWADQVVTYIREVSVNLWEKYGQKPTITPTPTPPETALLFIPMLKQFISSKF